MTAALVDEQTGEMLSQLTMPELNHRMVQLSNRLDANTEEIRRIADEKEHADLAYKLHFNAAIVTSKLGATDKRKAEAEMTCAAEPWGDDEGLAHAVSRLDVQLRTEREAGHNVRAQMSAMQSVASNLRSEISGLGWRP